MMPEVQELPPPPKVETLVNAANFQEKMLGQGDGPPISNLKEVPTSIHEELEESFEIEYEDPFEGSNRQQGSRIVGFAEIIVAGFLIAFALTCIECSPYIIYNPCYDQQELEVPQVEKLLIPLRFRLEIFFILIRSVLTVACGVVLIAAANKRSIAHCRVCTLINIFLISFHYSYGFLGLILDKVFVLFWSLPELVPTILFFWTVFEFEKELRYYKKKGLKCPYNC